MIKNGCKIIRETKSWSRAIYSDNRSSNVVTTDLEVPRTAKSGDRHNGM